MIRLLGALLSVTFFAAIGIALVNTTPVETHTAKAGVINAEKVEGLVSLCQVRRCV